MLILSYLDDQSKEFFRNYLVNTEVQILSLRWCFRLKILVEGTLVGLTASIVKFIAGLVVGTDGVDAVVATEEVVTGAAAEEVAFAAETGLSIVRVFDIIVTTLRSFIYLVKPMLSRLPH